MTLALLALLAAQPADGDDARRVEVIQACLPAVVDITGVNVGADGTHNHYVGSGVLLHEAGYILTNAHVVGDGRLTARLDDSSAFPCRVVARHPSEDLAVVKIDAGRSLAAIAIGRNEGLRVGDPVIVIGNPNGLTHTVTTGIVSRLPAGYVENGQIQTTAPVNGGNSGGPLLNERGELLGVVTAKGGGEAIGLAIPVDRVRARFAEMMLDEMSRGYRVGCAVDTVSDEARVTAVVEGSPAATAGVAVGDIVLKVAGTSLRHGIDFYLMVGDRPPADAFELEVRRGERVETLTVTPAAIPLRPAEEGEFVHGLAYEAFEGEWSALPDFAALAPAACGWTSHFGLHVPGAKPVQFALRFQGFVNVPTDGAYSFYTLSDDGSRLWIGDELVVENDGPHPPTEHRGWVRLAAGKHPITVAFFQGAGGVELKVFWSGPGLEKQEIPAGSLFVRP